MNQTIKHEAAGNTTSIVNTEEPIIIAIDHGYGNIKTSNFCFPANVTPINDGLCFTDDILIYDGTSYAVGMGHKEFRADKIMDKAALPWQSWFGFWPNCHGSILRIEARHRGLLPAHAGSNRERTQPQRHDKGDDRHCLRRRARIFNSTVGGPAKGRTWNPKGIPTFGCR